MIRVNCFNCKNARLQGNDKFLLAVFLVNFLLKSVTYFFWGPRFVTVCDRGREGIKNKKARYILDGLIELVLRTRRIYLLPRLQVDLLSLRWIRLSLAITAALFTTYLLHHRDHFHGNTTLSTLASDHNSNHVQIVHIDACVFA